MKKLLLSLMFVTVLAAGCSLNGGNVIMKVNGEPITQSQFDETFDDWVGSSIFANNKDAFKNKEDNMLYGIFKDKVVNELIYQTLLEQEIKKRNIIVSNEDYEKEVERLISIFGSKNELNNFLRDKGISAGEFKKRTMAELKVRKLADSIKKVDISDADVSNYYKKRIKNFSYPERVRASHILILADADEYAAELKKKNPEIAEEDLKKRVDEEMTARKAKAEEVLAQVKKNPRDFAKIAKAKSDDRTSAKNGGELGFFARREMVKEFSDAAFALPINQVSGLVKSKYGYHIIIVTDRMEPGTYPFAKVKGEIAQTLKTQKQMEIINGLLDALKANANIEFVDKSYEVSELQKMIDQNQEIEK